MIPSSRLRGDGAPPSISAWTLAIALALGLAYLFLVGHRPVFYIPGADYDDELFASTAMRLASGHWLGAYGPTTLIKGIGFPVFLAINSIIGLPANTGLCLAYAAAGAYLCVVLRPLLRSDAAALTLLALLLFIPPLASSATMRLNREFFYTAIVLGFLASAVNLFWRRAPLSSWAAGPLTGALGGWMWLTREEGVWVLPAIALIAVTGWIGGQASRRSIVVGVSVALVTSVGLVTGVGLVNRLAYGSFVVNEVKSASFQDALTMLEKASYADWKPYLPVPAAARAKLYRESPSFRLLQPFLDPPGGPSPWMRSGCEELPTACGDIAGGWFLWAFREAVFSAGQAESPRHAADFYRKVGAEVRAACNERRLTCARWLVPMVPPFTRSQAFRFGDNLRASIGLAVMLEPPDDGWPAIAALGGGDMQQLELTSVPEHGPGRIVLLHGSLSGPAASGVTMVGLDSAQVVQFDQTVDPAQAPVSDGTRRSRFTATIACLLEPCAVRLGDGSGATSDLGVAPTLQPPDASIPVGASAFTIEDVTASDMTVRTRAAAFWVRHLPSLQVFYQLVLGVGALCYLLGLAAMIVGRRMSPLIAIATALGTAATARAVLLALIDATSFPALNYGYMAPALPLVVAAAVVSVVEVVMLLRGILLRKV